MRTTTCRAGASAQCTEQRALKAQKRRGHQGLWTGRACEVGLRGQVLVEDVQGLLQLGLFLLRVLLVALLAIERGEHPLVGQGLLSHGDNISAWSSFWGVGSSMSQWHQAASSAAAAGWWQQRSLRLWQADV